jgi:hypothetical protein
MEDGNVWVASDLGSFAVSGGQQVMPFLMNNRVDNANTRNAYLGGMFVLGLISSCCSYLLLL